MSTVNINGLSYKSGDKISCYINENFINDAILHISNGQKRMYICHSQKSSDGEISPNLYGHTKSWVFSQNENGLTENVSNIVPLSIPIFDNKNVNISDNLKCFFELSDLKYILNILNYKIGIFDEYTNFKISENNIGFINMSTDNGKVLEIRFGRFLKKVMLNFTKTCPEKNSFTDVFLEKTFNRFVSFSKKDCYNVEFLMGEDILIGYNSENQLFVSGSSLSGSCMNNKLNFLNIYTKNDDVVQLAVIYDENKKIVARTLIWNINSKIFHDKIYFAKEWLYDFFTLKLKELNIEDIYDEKYKEKEQSIQLENWLFKEYPYIDTFSIFDPEKGRLYFNPKDVKSHYHSLKNQNGLPNLI